MTFKHVILIRIPPSEVLPSIFEWLLMQGLEHSIDWSWDTANILSGDNGDYDYKFKFNKEEHATMFALRWK